MNATVETYLRSYVCYDQGDWDKLIPIAELAINARTSSATGVSPFFLTHGYDLSPFNLTEDLPEQSANQSPIQIGENIARTIKEAMDWAKASLAYAQQEAERHANKKRAPAPTYKPGDKVWLNLRNIRTERPCKKLDWKNAKYTVTKLIGTHALQLNTPPGIHPVFHVDLVRLANKDKLPSQIQDDSQPPPILVDDEEEYYVDSVLDKRWKKIGRGGRWEYLVKWTGWANPTWEPAHVLEETEAAQAYELQQEQQKEDQSDPEPTKRRTNTRRTRSYAQDQSSSSSIGARGSSATLSGSYLGSRSA
jgi:hypothetical protein